MINLTPSHHFPDLNCLPAVILQLAKYKQLYFLEGKDHSPPPATVYKVRDLIMDLPQHVWFGPVFHHLPLAKI